MVEKSNNAELSKQLAAKDERISDMESRVGVLNAQVCVDCVMFVSKHSDIVRRLIHIET